MELDQVTYKGPELVDEEILSALPNNLSSLLKQINGFIQYNGGFHLFGACNEPKWHSIRELWHGDHAAHKHYPGIERSDVPFAEDCLGFQFFLREGEVIFLDGETGFVEELKMGLKSFFEWTSKNPVETLSMQPLIQLFDEGSVCEPGELLAEYPFFCTEESKDGVQLGKVPALERRAFLIDLYKQVQGLEEGGKFEVVLSD